MIQEPLLRGGCICDWEDGCGGTGTLYCTGCGGDQCVCRCGGEMPCFGCEDCNFWEGLEEVEPDAD